MGAMELPFTRQEFFGLFADYNEAIWPAQALAVVAGLGAVALLNSGAAWASRAIAAILGALLIWNGLVYHWLFFTRINPAAWLFGTLFLAGGAVFLLEGALRNRIGFAPTRGYRNAMSGLLILYAVVLYPLIGLIVEGYPATPLFGVTPCPTTIFALGLLMLSSHRRPVLLAAMPLLWVFIGGTAAVILAVPQDWGLIAAGAIWLTAPTRRREQAAP